MVSVQIFLWAVVGEMAWVRWPQRVDHFWVRVCLGFKSAKLSTCGDVIRIWTFEKLSLQFVEPEVELLIFRLNSAPTFSVWCSCARNLRWGYIKQTCQGTGLCCPHLKALEVILAESCMTPSRAPELGEDWRLMMIIRKLETYMNGNIIILFLNHSGQRSGRKNWYQLRIAVTLRADLQILSHVDHPQMWKRRLGKIILTSCQIIY